jgi:hypothetical protein
MDFIEIARFNSRLEAETIGHALDQYGIPFIVKSENVGVFGPGAEGPNLWGATLWVPEDKANEVAQLLNCVVRPLENNPPPT